jgi:biopolymer transport protein ExbD
MRWPSPFRDRHKSIELQLTPMIDCVFLLMVYFIWSSSFVVAEKMLPSELSAARGTATESASATPPPAADFDPIVIRVLATVAGPAWRVNDTPLASLADLEKLLATIAGINRTAPLVIHPDPDVPLGDVIDVLDLARVAGFGKVKLAAAGDL